MDNRETKRNLKKLNVHSRGRSINSEIAWPFAYLSERRLSRSVHNAKRKMKEVGVAAETRSARSASGRSLNRISCPIFGSAPHRRKLQKPIPRK